MDDEQTEGLDVACGDGVLRITMNRPAQLNAMTAAMSDRIAAELEGAAARDDVRVVLLAGAGGAFSSGADLSGADAHENFDVTSLDRANRIIRAIVSLDKPCVAAVAGIAAGVGCSAALACDLVVASGSASFLLAFARIGLMPDGGATATVAASVGRARAMRMALLGEALPAADAYAAGLVSHLAADDEFEETVEKLVARLAAGPPLALRGDQEGGQRRDARSPARRAGARADRSDRAAADRRTWPRACARSAEKRRPVFRGESAVSGCGDRRSRTSTARGARA